MRQLFALWQFQQIVHVAEVGVLHVVIINRAADMTHRVGVAVFDFNDGVKTLVAHRERPFIDLWG
ncbi:hypothetical protein D3C79_939770 [compost metagenome]